MWYFWFFTLFEESESIPVWVFFVLFIVDSLQNSAFNYDAIVQIPGDQGVGLFDSKQLVLFLFVAHEVVLKLLGSNHINSALVQLGDDGNVKGGIKHSYSANSWTILYLVQESTIAVKNLSGLFVIVEFFLHVEIDKSEYILLVLEVNTWRVSHEHVLNLPIKVDLCCSLQRVLGSQVNDHQVTQVVVI